MIAAVLGPKQAILPTKANFHSRPGRDTRPITRLIPQILELRISHRSKMEATLVRDDI